MKALFIGGTGTISSAISELVIEQGWELTLINRGNRATELDERIQLIQADIHNEEQVCALLADKHYDVVVDFIAFSTADLERDYRLFRDKTNQFIFISSASAYQKPLSNYVINEGTPLANPYWQYSRDKIAGEEFLMDKYRQEGFPITIVRPSHTYNEQKVPLGFYGKNGSWQVLKRMLDGKPVIIHGDGTSLWTMTHSSDFAKGFVGLMGNVRAIGEAVQITSDESLTWNQIYSTIARALGVPLKAMRVSSQFLAASSHYNYTGSLLGDKANTVVFDNTKIKSLCPGFHAEVRMDQGITRSVEYALAHRDSQVEDPEFDAWCDNVITTLTSVAASLKAISPKV